MGNAYQVPVNVFSLPSHEAIANHLLVKCNSDGEAAIAGAGEIPIGAAIDAVDAADQPLDIADGIVICVASEQIAAGSRVKCASGGKVAAATAVTQALTGESQTITIAESYNIGTALTAAGANNEYITVKLDK